jgi:hypothetical protein
MSRRKELCDDPDCPARVSCTYAYTRSAEHAAVSNRSVPMRRRERRSATTPAGNGSWTGRGNGFSPKPA